MAFTVPVRGGSNPAASTPTVMYTAAANAVVFLKISNTSASVAASVAVWTDALSGGTTTDDEVVLATTIPAGDSLSWGPLVLLDTDDLIVFATTADVNFHFDGFEEA